MALPMYEQYIDTDVHGLIVNIPHNLDGYPFVSFLKVVDVMTNKQVYMSLYDPTIAEIEPINKSNTKVSFAAPFKGYFKAILGDKEDLLARLMGVEADINFIYEQLEQRVTNNQFDQMNALRDQQLKLINDKVDGLDLRLDSLEIKVDLL